MLSSAHHNLFAHHSVAGVETELKSVVALGKIARLRGIKST